MNRTRPHLRTGVGVAVGNENLGHAGWQIGRRGTSLEADGQRPSEGYCVGEARAGARPALDEALIAKAAGALPAPVTTTLAPRPRRRLIFSWLILSGIVQMSR